MFTIHRHEIPNTPKTPFRDETKICGGIGLCKTCSKQAARLKEMFPPDPSDPNEPQLMLW